MRHSRADRHTFQHRHKRPRDSWWRHHFEANASRHRLWHTADKSGRNWRPNDGYFLTIKGSFCVFFAFPCFPLLFPFFFPFLIPFPPFFTLPYHFFPFLPFSPFFPPPLLFLLLASAAFLSPLFLSFAFTSSVFSSPFHTFSPLLSLFYIHIILLF